MNKLTLIKRSTPTCPSCKVMEMVLNDADIPFDVIDIAEDGDAVEKYNLSSVPVMIFDEEDGGQSRLNGIQPIELVKEFLN